MRRIIGNIFIFISFIILVIFGPWSLVIVANIFHRIGGFFGVIIGFAVLPITYLIVPFISLFWGDWLPLLVIYGGGTTFITLFYVGSFIRGD